MQPTDKLQQFQKGLYIATAVALLTVGAYAQVRGEAEAKIKGGGDAVGKLPELLGISRTSHSVDILNDIPLQYN